jgi:hypothetical protein
MDIWTKLLSDLFSDTVGIASISVIALTCIVVSVLLSMFVVKSR